ncbi:hypothetical protein VM1G_11908 [Cytospora mali]|uniref:Uncharacterized protein n=1 Tax=Cytospora mali TaxID=578113 RepID=A0A194W9E6_CYTMA|nr:hypothetical protein VM1G_11908 [Valsa mali]
MAPITADDIKEFREAELRERKVQSLGWAFAGVPRRTADGDEHTKSRVEKLGFAFTQVPMKTKHEDWFVMSKAEQDAVRARLESEQAIPAGKISEIIAKVDVGGLRPKWSWVRSPIRGEYVDVVWVGKDSNEGVDRFWVAPLDEPIQMLVGREFTPEVFMEEFPVLKPHGMLLTMQAKMQAKMQASGSPEDVHVPGS